LTDEKAGEKKADKGKREKKRKTNGKERAS